MAKKYNAHEIAEREKLWKRFNSVTGQLLGLEQEVYVGEQGSFMFWFESEKFGKVTIYPKGDKIHISKSNKWINGVENWLKENVIKEKF